ncbi:MAG TPA: hypothetical protein PLN21_04020 [Gemmatales bacterium]|nr:hypothetical protein [Gemmatales bacterium]
MARCDQGYLCDVCGEEVENLIDSDLYLRYILGEVPPEALIQSKERHLRCNPAMAQFIVDPAFDHVICDGPYSKLEMDSEFVRAEEARITRGWQRLQQLPKLGVPVTEYPLPEVRASWGA